MTLKDLTAPDNEVLIVSNGTMARICKTAMDLLTEKGHKVGMVRPIAGTRPRGATPEEDNALEADLERLSDELRDSTLGIRMLPIGTTFGRFRRLVRDLSADLDKEIELATQGGETELDKTVLERLGDPVLVSPGAADGLLAVSSSGPFLVVWAECEQGEGLATFGRCFASDGSPRSDELRIDTVTDPDTLAYYSKHVPIRAMERLMAWMIRVTCRAPFGCPAIAAMRP